MIVTFCKKQQKQTWFGLKKSLFIKLFMYVENSVYGAPAVPVTGDGLEDKGLNVTPVGVNFI